MNKQLGTKWFTFYTKVRPWFACLAVFTVAQDFVQYQDVYTRYWWMTVYFLAALVQPVLCIVVFAKSQGDYEDFVRFVKGVLLFETINLAYSQAVKQYIQNDLNIGIALIVGAIIFVLGYFLWYRLNMHYFKKRIAVVANDYLPVDSNANQVAYTNKDSVASADEIRFCRKCGGKLIADSRFCCRCGTEVVGRQRGTD